MLQPNSFETTALAQPEFDYFEHVRPEQPKRAIGEYVLSKGFAVPLLTDQTDIRTAIENESAFFRSELAQDYDGLGGIYSSSGIDNWIDRWHDDRYRVGVTHINHRLKSGLIDANEYMWDRPHYSSWIEERARLVESFRLLQLDPEISRGLMWPTTSVWKYIPGTNVSIFRDPHVDGRYHFGVKPHQGPIGDYLFEDGEHSIPQQFRKHREPFVATPFIELYEEIRALPLFDTTQVPVMEMIQDEDGVVHFLQYRKVNKKLELTDPFDIPRTDDDYYTETVRGVTPPEGLNFTVAINPLQLATVGTTRALYADIFYMKGFEHPHMFQLACRHTDLAICDDSISFKDNHTSSVPVYVPKLAVGIYGCSEDSVRRFRWFENELPSSLRPDLHEKQLYLDVRVIANGRAATIVSNWELYE